MLMKKVVLFTALSFLLIACNDEEPAPLEEMEETPIETEEDAPLSWGQQITQISESEDNADNKFYALESYMKEYKATMPEIELFQSQTLASFKNDSYLTEIDNHEKMLTEIFQSYVLSTHVKDEAWQTFSENYYDNVTAVYRGLEETSSEVVQTNETAMTEAATSLQ